MAQAAGFIDEILIETDGVKVTKSIYNDILDDVYLKEVKENLNDQDLVDKLE